MLLSDYDYAVILLVDYRYETDSPRVTELLESKGVKSIRAFVDGKGEILHRKLYNQISPSMPPCWKDGPYSYSHFTAMKKVVSQAKDSGAANILFVEDDVVFTGEFDAVTNHVRQELPDDWDMLYYGANHSDSRTQHISDHIIRVFGSTCTHCVGIRNTMFDSILSLPPDRTIDWNIANRLHDSHRCYAVWPTVAMQRPGYSLLWRQPVDYSALWPSRGKPV